MTKIAAHVLAFNVSKFIGPVLRNMAPHVDTIYVARSRLPFGYNKNARGQFENETTIEQIFAGDSDVVQKIQLIAGDWAHEEDARNECLKRATLDGHDWLITQDADEFYPDESWDVIHWALKNVGGAHLRTTWYNFWKSSHYVLLGPTGEIKQFNASFAMRCDAGIHFVNKRKTNAPSTRVLDAPCFHYCYALSDEELVSKLITWGHTNEVDFRNWFRFKWKNWNQYTSNLHPIRPKAWKCAIRFPFSQPHFAEEFYADIDNERVIPIKEYFYDKLYNLKLGLYENTRFYWHMLQAR